MKKIFVASLFLALGSLAQAGKINCSPVLSPVVVSGVPNAGAVFTCSPGLGDAAGTADDNMAGDGVLVSTIQLGLGGSLADSGGPNGVTYQVQFSATNSLVPSPGNMGCIAIGPTVTGTPPAQNTAVGACSSTTGVLDIADVDVLGAFTVTVTGAAVAGFALPDTGLASVAYQVNTSEPNPEVPEPSTYAMMAAGLVGFYMVRRRS